MVQEFVYGVYSSLNEAEAVVDELTGKGVSRSGIKLLANDDVVNHAQTLTQVESIDNLTQKTHHWWDGLLDFFTFDSPNANRAEAERKIDFSGYKADIDEGKVLVVVDGAFEDAAYHVNLGTTPSPKTGIEETGTEEKNVAGTMLETSNETSEVNEDLATNDGLSDEVVMISSDQPLSDSPDAWVKEPGKTPETESPDVWVTPPPETPLSDTSSGMTTDLEVDRDRMDDTYGVDEVNHMDESDGINAEAGVDAEELTDAKATLEDSTNHQKPNLTEATALPKAETDYQADRETDRGTDHQNDSETDANLPNNLHNPLSGASMADEPGVNIEEFENLTETEVEQLDRVPDNSDNQDNPLSGTETSDLTETSVEREALAAAPIETDVIEDEVAHTYGDPTIHEETVERNTRRFDDLRHPRENITPTDVQQAVDEIRDPK